MDATRYPIALSTWAIHKALGYEVEDNPDQGPQPFRALAGSPANVADIPGLAAAHGFHRLELCHFHFDRRAGSSDLDFKVALRAEDVTLQTLLIDEGDLTHPDPAVADRHEAWIASWLETAEALGAERARVIAGRTKREGDLDAAALRLKRLASRTSVRITTENWLAVLDTPERTLELLDRCEGTIGLNVDLGNWTGLQKYDWIAQVAARAETCHAKCEVDHRSRLDTHDFAQAVDAATRVGYEGPLTLVHGGGADREWELVMLQAGFLRARSEVVA